MPLSPADFDFELPERLIAKTPAEPRDSARLLVYDSTTGNVDHTSFRSLVDYLDPKDLLVLNDTRVLPHRLVGRMPGGGRAEALLLERDGERARGYLKPAKKARLGVPLAFEGGALELVPEVALGGGLFRFTVRAPGGEVGAVLERVGRAPLPPYIKRGLDEDVAADRERYQTVYAAVPGAVAAPTAGLHFTQQTLAALAAKGIARASVTLHVGEGTFAPVRVTDLEQHVMHAERYVLPEATAAAVAAVRARGGRVVAVGTTAARVLESCATETGLVRAGEGETRLFLHPGKPLRVVDALLTNFHLPQSTLLMLVSAFLGRETTLALYREAVARGYRFFSFGDAMLGIRGQTRSTQHGY